MRRAIGLVLLVGALSVAQGAAAQDAAAQDEALPPPPTGDSIGASPRAEGQGDVPLPAPSDALATPDGYLHVAAAPTRRAAPNETRLDVVPYGDTPLRLRLTGRDGRSQQCTGPCTLTLTPGRYQLALGQHSRSPRGVDDAFRNLAPGRTVALTNYDHRGGLRVLGWTFFSVAATTLALAGVFVVLGSVALSLIIGLPIAIVFLVPFLPLAFLEDSPRVELFTVPL